MGKKYDELKCLFDDYREYHSLGARLVRKIEQMIKPKYTLPDEDLNEVDWDLIFRQSDDFDFNKDLKSKFTILVCDSAEKVYNELRNQDIKAYIISLLTRKIESYVQVGSIYGSIDICNANIVDYFRGRRFDSEYLLISSSIPSNVVSHFMPSFPNVKQVVYFDEVL